MTFTLNLYSGDRGSRVFFCSVGVLAISVGYVSNTIMVTAVSDFPPVVRYRICLSIVLHFLIPDVRGSTSNHLQ